MKGLILSRFDQIVGPSILFKAPDTLEITYLDKFASLMDIYEEDFLIHIYKGIKSYNLLFDITSEFARGKKEIIQLSLLLDINTEFDPETARNLLNNLKQAISSIEDLYTAFYLDTPKYRGNPEKLEELKTVFFSFFESISSTFKLVKQLELRYKALFESARDAIVLFDKDSEEILDVNNKSEKIFALSKDNIINQNFFSLCSITDEYLKQKILSLADTEEEEPIEMIIINAQNKKIPADLNASKIKLDDRIIIQAIIRDMSYRKKIESKLIESEFKLKERVKELDSLYQISKLFDQKKQSLEKLYSKILVYIIRGLRYPEKACARIQYDDREYKTPNFSETPWKISTHIEINRLLLDLDVFYLEDLPFLEEKLHFIYDAAKRIKHYLE